MICGTTNIIVVVLYILSPTSDGSAAAVICSEKFVYRYGLESQAVEIVAQAMRTDFSSTFDENSSIKAVCDCTICKSILLFAYSGWL